MHTHSCSRYIKEYEARQISDHKEKNEKKLKQMHVCDLLQWKEMCRWHTNQTGLD